MDTLLELGTDAALLLGRYLDRQLDRQRKTNQRAEDALVKGFSRAAKGIVDASLDREGQARMEAARAAVLGAAREKDLTKDTIKRVSDPAVAQLEELLVVLPPRSGTLRRISSTTMSSCSTASRRRDASTTGGRVRSASCARAEPRGRRIGSASTPTRWSSRRVSRPLPCAARPMPRRA